MENICAVKRIDDMGRIIIPKEIRRIINAAENDSFEISVDKGRIILTPFNTFDNIGGAVKFIITELFTHCRIPLVVCDLSETVWSEGIAITQGTKLSSLLAEYIVKRREYIYRYGDSELHIGEDEKYKVSAAIPIISASNMTKCIGALILVGGTERIAEPAEEQLSLSRFAVSLIANQLAV